MASSSSSQTDLSGPTFCVLSGASQGIGRAIAVEVSKHLGPLSVMLLLARNKVELANTAELCKSNNVHVVYNSIDLSKASKEEMSAVLNQALEGRKVSDFETNIIFHNVGSIGNLAVETSRMENVEELRKYYDLNVFNVIALNTQFLKIFEEVEERIVIVNITSLCAIKPMSGMAYYCSGKAARELYFKVLAEEKKNVRVLNYSPGPVETAMIDYVISEAVNDNLKDVFHSFKLQGTLLKPEMTAKKCLKVLLSGKFSPGEHVDYFDDEFKMTAGRKGLFLFLMNLAWQFRYSMPLLLTGTVAVLGQAWMLQIRVHTVHQLHENELDYYDDEEDQDDDDDSWSTQTTGSWETIVEEVAYG